MKMVFDSFLRVNEFYYRSFNELNTNRLWSLQVNQSLLNKIMKIQKLALIMGYFLYWNKVDQKWPQKKLEATGVIIVFNLQTRSAWSEVHTAEKNSSFFFIFTPAALPGAWRLEIFLSSSKQHLLNNIRNYL